MPRRRYLALTAEQRQLLTRWRDRHPKPYVRERAAALLKVAEGLPAAQVARTGLFRPRKTDTVYHWLDRFEQHGPDGLLLSPGRGRKPAFSPSLP